MKINIKDKYDLPYIHIEDTFTQIELIKMKHEMEFLYEKLGDQYATNAAVEHTDFIARKKKNGLGVFLDEVYRKRYYSNILTYTRKFFHDNTFIGVIRELSNISDYWKLWETTNFDSTLLQAYSEGDYYDYHKDHSLFTVVSTFKFSSRVNGGEFNLKCTIDREEEISTHKLEHNESIIFPSLLEHAVSTVKLKGDEKIGGTIKNDYFIDKRWSIAHLIDKLAIDRSPKDD